jgi:hypothetical protein
LFTGIVFTGIAPTRFAPVRRVTRGYSRIVVMAILLGVGCAVVASILYSVQLAVQALDARTVRLQHAYRLSLFGRLIGRRRWVVANLVGALGWPLQILALLLAPVTLVQPALGIGLVGLVLAAGRWMGERVDRRTAAGVAAILAGLAIATSAAPQRSDTHASFVLLAPVLILLGALAVTPYAVPRLRRSGRAGTWSAGFAFAFGALVTKLFSDQLGTHPQVGGLAVWLVLIVTAAGVGILSEMSALQQRRIAQVVPAAFAIETLVPVALAPVLVGETWPSGGAAAVLLTAFGLVAAGAVTLERSAPLDRLRSGAVEAAVPRAPEPLMSAVTREGCEVTP